MSNCKECKHWRRIADSYDGEHMNRPLPYGECLRITDTSWFKEDGETESPNDRAYLATVAWYYPGGEVSADNSIYTRPGDHDTSLLTSPDFGCIEHESKEA